VCIIPDKYILSSSARNNSVKNCMTRKIPESDRLPIFRIKFAGHVAHMGENRKETTKKTYV
jgi:hypothetical protein